MFKKLFKFGKKKQEEANDNEVVNEHDTAIEENNDNVNENKNGKKLPSEISGKELFAGVDDFIALQNQKNRKTQFYGGARCINQSTTWKSFVLTMIHLIAMKNGKWLNS